MVTRSPHKRLLIAAALVLGLFAFAPGIASAQLIDPADLHINGGTTYLFGNDVHGVSSGLVNVLQNNGGADNLNNPWYLILGIAGQTNGTGLPTISSVTTTGGGSTSFSAGTFKTTFTAADGSTDVYSKLGFPFSQADTNSQIFKNWHDADLAINGLNVSSFGLVTYQISANLAAKDVASIQFDSLPLGTFVIAFGTTSTHVFDTPFTESGVSTDNNHITSTPEPSTMALALWGLVGAGFAGLRRLRRPQAATV